MGCFGLLMVVYLMGFLWIKSVWMIVMNSLMCRDTRKSSVEIDSLSHTHILCQKFRPKFVHRSAYHKGPRVDGSSHTAMIRQP